MKKTAALLITALLLTGCRENYLAEKAYYRANNLLKSIEGSLNKSESEGESLAALEPAIKAFSDVKEKYPTSPKAAESLFKIAELRIRQKKFEDARAALRQVIPNFSESGEWASNARFQIAQTYEAESNWTEAEKSYWETAEYHPTHSKGLYAPLYVFLHYKIKMSKDVAKQAEAYQKAVEHYQHYIEQIGPIEASCGIKNSLALVYAAQGNWEQARAEWFSIVDRFPGNPYAPLSILTVADIVWKQKNFDQALQDYELFFKRYPKHAVAGKTAIHLGILYQDQKQYAKAREWFERAATQYFKRDVTAKADLMLLIGKSYQDEGKWDEAEQTYKELETLYPSTSAALQVSFPRFVHFKSVGELEKADKILDEAIKQYQKIIHQKPKSKLAGYAKQFMYQAYTQKKDWEELMTNVDQEVLSETAEDQKGRWLFLKGLIAENRLKDRERAIQFYQDLINQYPAHPLAQVAKNHQEILSKV